MTDRTPPRLAAFLLRLCLPRGHLGEAVLGDLHEAYLERVGSKAAEGPALAAALWYWAQVPLVGGRYLVRRAFLRGLYGRLAPVPRRPVIARSRESSLNDAIRDLRLALRLLGRRPGFAAATILVLGLGIGAVSLMFSTYNTVVLQPLPFPHPERLFWIWETIPNGSRNSLSYDDFVDFRDGTDAFEALGAVGVFSQRRLLTGSENPQQVTGYPVSASLFTTLGVSPELGRAFVDDDETRGVEDVVLLSHGLWTRRYGADPDLVGKTIGVDGRPVEVVGILPRGFEFPADTDVWFPLQRSAGYSSGRGNNNFFAVGRLREGVDPDLARTQMAAVAAHIAEAYPDSKAGWGVELQTLHERFFGAAGATLLLLMGVISLVPLVACANVASLFMARGLTRHTELASRLALGASRSRLLRQLVTESLVVALGGGVVGLVLAYSGGEMLRRLAPAALPRLEAIGVDLHVAAFTLLAALLTVPLIGVIPALRTTDLDIAESLKTKGGRPGSERGLRGQRNLVIIQVALSTMLLLVSSQLVEDYLALQAEDPGFQTENVLFSQVTLPDFEIETSTEAELIWKDLIEHLRTIPGVLAVGTVSRPPISGRGPTNEVWAAQRPPASAAEKKEASRRSVSDGFFATLGIPLVAGRAFERQDELAGLPVTVVNETLARKFFPGENPIGQTLVLDWSSGIGLTILGVVEDVREQGPGTDVFPAFYLPTWWFTPTEMYLVARTQGHPSEIAGAWRAAIRTVNPDIPGAPLQTMDDRLATPLFQPKFRSALVVVFALVSLILSAIGLYGVLAHFVRRHAPELGIRLALGATGERVARLVVARGMSLVGWGILLGLASGIAAVSWARSRGWLPPAASHDPTTYLAVASCLFLVALTACAAPALRALRIDPVEVMRTK